MDLGNERGAGVKAFFPGKKGYEGTKNVLRSLPRLLMETNPGSQRDLEIRNFGNSEQSMHVKIQNR
jgi:hypothetical protein